MLQPMIMRMIWTRSDGGEELMKKKKWERIWKLLFFVPGIVGLYGIINLNEGTFWDCIYKTAQLYVMEFSVESEVLNPAT